MMPLRKKKEARAGLGKSISAPPLEEVGTVVEPGIIAEAMTATRGKKPKKSKSKKSKAADFATAELQKRTSSRVLIEALPGFTKEDAIEQAKHHALDHCENPSNSFYHVEKIDDGWMIEVQDGVGYSYLASAIKLANENPNRTIAVPMLRRYLTIHYSERTGLYDTNILPEQEEPEDVLTGKPLFAERGVAMKPVMKQFKEWLVAGVGTAAVGCVALVASLGFYLFDAETQIPPEWRTSDTGNLPIMQWDTLMEGDGDSYVVRMEFSDGEWRTVRQSANAIVDVAASPEAAGAMTPLPSAGSVQPAAELPPMNE